MQIKNLGVQIWLCLHSGVSFMSLYVCSTESGSASVGCSLWLAPLGAKSCVIPLQADFSLHHLFSSCLLHYWQCWSTQVSLSTSCGTFSGCSALAGRFIAVTRSFKFWVLVLEICWCAYSLSPSPHPFSLLSSSFPHLPLTPYSLLTLQTCIATHESNGIDIIIALILNDINPLGKYCMDLVLQLKVQ